MSVPFSLPPTPGVRASMAQALALVRSGELQRASSLLMQGLQAGAGSASSDTHSAAAPRSGFTRTGNRSSAARFSHGDAVDVPARWTGYKLHAKAPESASREPGRFTSVSFQYAGAERPFQLYVPASAPPPEGRPLILMLHGCTQDAQDFARGTGMNHAAEAAGALVLYPTQLRAANQNGCWNWFRPEDQHAEAGEPALLLAMVRQVMATQGVDPRRVYVAGLSAGGAMAALLVREYAQVFAAAGVHSGLAAGAAQNMMGALSAMKSGAKGFAPVANPAASVPLIVFHGDRDTTVHPRNGEQLLQAAAPGLRAETQSGQSADGRRYTRTALRAPGALAVQAEHWLLHGAGHAWSGGDARGSHTSAAGVNASQEMLRFFLEHPQGRPAAM